MPMPRLLDLIQHFSTPGVFFAINMKRRALFLMQTLKGPLFILILFQSNVSRHRTIQIAYKKSLYDNYLVNLSETVFLFSLSIRL